MFIFLKRRMLLWIALPVLAVTGLIAHNSLKPAHAIAPNNTANLFQASTPTPTPGTYGPIISPNYTPPPSQTPPPPTQQPPAEQPTTGQTPPQEPTQPPVEIIPTVTLGGTPLPALPKDV
ncbi:MAG: hypothetical protein JW966_00640, partial [Anaerolineae bacterium]|nr:hypothetical protein [Anaerolineae bacterium]